MVCLIGKIFYNQYNQMISLENTLLNNLMDEVIEAKEYKEDSREYKAINQIQELYTETIDILNMCIKNNYNIWIYQTTRILIEIFLNISIISEKDTDERLIAYYDFRIYNASNSVKKIKNNTLSNEEKDILKKIKENILENSWLNKKELYYRRELIGIKWKIKDLLKQYEIQIEDDFDLYEYLSLVTHPSILSLDENLYWKNWLEIISNNIRNNMITIIYKTNGLIDRTWRYKRNYIIDKYINIVLNS